MKCFCYTVFDMLSFCIYWMGVNTKCTIQNFYWHIHPLNLKKTPIWQKVKHGVSKARHFIYIYIYIYASFTKIIRIGKNGFLKMTLIIRHQLFKSWIGKNQMHIASPAKLVICWSFKILFYLILLRLSNFCCSKSVIFGNAGRIPNDVDTTSMFNCKVYLVTFTTTSKFCHANLLSLFETIKMKKVMY